MSMVVINQSGPLPIKAQINWPDSEPVVVAVSGSAWTQYANSMLAVEVQINGQTVGTLQQFANPASTHLAFPAGFFVVRQPIGPATIYLGLANGETTTDQNDFFTVTLIF